MTTLLSSETNWIVSRGSLDSAVTFESFDFPIDSESTGRKPPLLLVPPSSSDFETCEIKLNFTQKHEIRQVYVRSTARVYEIYYAPALQSDNEYLCTVRCSAASVEENLFSSTDVKEAISVNFEGPNVISPKPRVACENKIGTNEDDWVEVKLPVGQVDERNAYLPNQNYYEATAEINDSEPCTSLTLRLLSLQPKSCVYIDEIYVFADPIDTNDSENHTINTQTSASNSLMTMLVPTLLGLTKSKSLHSQIRVGKSATSTNSVNNQDEKLVKQSEVKLPALTLDKDKVSDSMTNNGYLNNRAESLLEQLVSRVSRIEDICLRFEENMLKPIKSLEVRLERVEQQVELIAKHSQFGDERELERKGSFSNGTHEPLEDAFVAESTQVLEKEEGNDVLESPKKEKTKQHVSIDDALAAALAGFSSFTKANDSLTGVPFESPEEDCLKRSHGYIDATLGSNSDDVDSVSSESLKASALEFTQESSMVDKGDSTTTSRDNSTEIPESTFYFQETSEVANEEDMGPTPSCIHHENYKTDDHLVKQDSIKLVKVLTFDKTDILKHFPDQVSISSNGEEVNNGSESRVDFESPILEVKFASLENGNRGSHIEALLSNTDDSVTDEEVFITTQWNDENKNIANNLLLDLDDNDVGEGLGDPDLTPVQQETTFTSLI